MVFGSFDGQMETDGEEEGRRGGGKSPKLSHVKINWNRMVVSAGFGWHLWVACGASIHRLTPVPQLIRHRSRGRGEARRKSTATQNITESQNSRGWKGPLGVI